MQKKPFLLLEILIALSLASVLLTFLFSFFVQSIKMEERINISANHILERQKFHILTQDTFLSIAGHIESCLYTKKLGKETHDSLVFTFDHGIDGDPEFSGIILGKIYLEDENLMFCMWPKNEDKKTPPWRKISLLKQVLDVNFSFLGSSKTKPLKHYSWEKSWPEDAENTPLFIKMNLTTASGSFEYTFFLPQNFPIPTYEEI